MAKQDSKDAVEQAHVQLRLFRILNVCLKSELQIKLAYQKELETQM
ncbi:hypothetical protein [Staphylococcus argensis]|nr:hypothetical protein [Staphylococcus argensis]